MVEPLQDRVAGERGSLWGAVVNDEADQPTLTLQPAVS